MAKEYAHQILSRPRCPAFAALSKIKGQSVWLPEETVKLFARLLSLPLAKELKVLLSVSFLCQQHRFLKLHEKQRKCLKATLSQSYPQHVRLSRYALQQQHRAIRRWLAGISQQNVTAPQTVSSLL